MTLALCVSTLCFLSIFVVFNTINSAQNEHLDVSRCKEEETAATFDKVLTLISALVSSDFHILFKFLTVPAAKPILLLSSFVQDP